MWLKLIEQNAFESILKMLSILLNSQCDGN